MKTSLLAGLLLLSGAAYGQNAPSTTYFLGGESDNAPAEEAFFPLISTHRHVDSGLARTGQATLQLVSRQRPTSFASSLLPVQLGQQLTVEVYAHYLLPSTRRRLPHAVEGIASGLILGTTPNLITPVGEHANALRRPFIGLGAAFALPHLLGLGKTAQQTPQAYIQYNLYDQTGTYVRSEQQIVSEAASTGWQAVQLDATVPLNGYIQLVLGSRSGAVAFDDLHATLRKAPAPSKVAVSALLRQDSQAKNRYSVRRIQRPVLPKGKASTLTAQLPKNQTITSLKQEQPTCIETVDVYTDLNTGQVIGEVLISTVCTGGSGGGGGGGGTGGGGGSTGGGSGGSNSSPATIIPEECAGLKQALSTQAANNKEVAGYVTTDGNVILFSTNGNTTTSFNIHFPLYDSAHQLVTNGPFQDNGVWKIEMNDWTNGHQVISYDISYGFHTHPIGTDPVTGNIYDSNHPSPQDYTNASHYPGMPNHIINQNNEITYDSTHVTNTSANHCP